MKHIRLSLTAVAVVTLAMGTLAMTAHAQTPTDAGAAAMVASEAQTVIATESPAPTAPAMTEGTGVQAAPGAVTTDATETPSNAPSAPVPPPPPPSGGLIDVAPGGSAPVSPTPGATEGTGLGPVSTGGTSTDSTGTDTAGTDTTGSSTTDTAPVVTVTRIGTDIATIENASAAATSTVSVFATPVVDLQAVFFAGTGLSQSTMDLSMTARAIDAGLIPVVNFSP